MLLGRGDTEAFREQRRCGEKRDKVRELTRTLQTWRRQKTTPARRSSWRNRHLEGTGPSFLQHSNATLCACKTLTCVRCAGKEIYSTTALSYSYLMLLYISVPQCYREIVCCLFGSFNSFTQWIKGKTFQIQHTIND